MAGQAAGREGYRGIHQASYEIGLYLAAEIVKLGPFELLCDSDPATGIPAVTLRIREGSDIPVQRVLVRLGVSRDMASMLLDDFRDGVAHFGRHQVAVPMSREEPSGFNHL